MEKLYKCVNCENTYWDDEKCPKCGSDDRYELEEIKRTYNPAYIDRVFNDGGW